ncbi:MAG TPA: serine hydrolase [Candidatus Aquilonibacter sp.]|nr:serine hydrolase [Candidatus Aquilonibacter sp.]
MKRHAFLAGLSALALPLPALAGSYERLESIARAVPGSIGACCRTLGDGPPVFAYNGDEPFPTASTIKVLIMATAFAMDEQRPGTLDERITTRRRDLISGSDFMSLQPDGARFTVRELLVPMIQLSDNTASNYLMSFFGFDTINAVGARAGMNHTHLARHFMDFAAIVRHNDNITTPNDMATLLYAIAHGAREGLQTVATPEHCKRMIDIMLGQTDRDGIPAALPPRIQVANKTGELDGVRNDIAIVEPFADSPYILTVYTKWLKDTAAGYHAMHRIARLSYHLAGKSNA